MNVKHIKKTEFCIPYIRIVFTVIFLITYLILPIYYTMEGFTQIQFNYFLILGAPIILCFPLAFLWGDYTPNYKEVIIHKVK